MKLGTLIKSLRINAGLSQKELSEKLKISTNYLCLVENGKRTPSGELIDRIAGVFEISRDAIDFLSTDVPTELDKKTSRKYRELQSNIASLLLFQNKKLI